MHDGSAWDRLDLSSGREGTRLRVRARAGARRTAVEGEHGGALKISVQVPPERGKANDRILRLLSETLGIPLAAVSLAAGHGSRDKIVLVAGLDAAEVRRRFRNTIRKP